MRKAYYLLLLLFSASACEKVIEEPVFDLKPRIELLSISQNSLLQFQDQLMVRISYEDGNGDLGNLDADINSIYVQDSRLSRPDEYYLAPLAPVDANVSIQGTLDIKLAPTFLLGNGDRETVVFSIYLLDRSGNQSNVIETEPISIIKN